MLTTTTKYKLSLVFSCTGISEHRSFGFQLQILRTSTENTRDLASLSRKQQNFHKEIFGNFLARCRSPLWKRVGFIICRRRGQSRGPNILCKEHTYVNTTYETCLISESQNVDAGVGYSKFKLEVTLTLLQNCRDCHVQHLKSTLMLPFNSRYYKYTSILGKEYAGAVS